MVKFMVGEVVRMYAGWGGVVLCILEARLLYLFGRSFFIGVLAIEVSN